MKIIVFSTSYSDKVSIVGYPFEFKCKYDDENRVAVYCCISFDPFT